MEKGHIFVFCGDSATGKSTLAWRLPRNVELIDDYSDNWEEVSYDVRSSIARECDTIVIVVHDMGKCPLLKKLLNAETTRAKYDVSLCEFSRLPEEES